MIKPLVNALRILVCAVVTVQLAGCGTLIHPERKGQRGGRIDVGIAVLDGIGLFFFLIPGIIAFVVDFDNGTIYLPGTIVKFDPKTSSLASIESTIKRETGREVKLYQDGTRVSKLKSVDDVQVALLTK